MHQTTGNTLGTSLYSNLLHNLTQARDIVDQALATAMPTMWVTGATTLSLMPRALAFSQDMFLNILLIASWQRIIQQCRQYLNDNLSCTNLM
jgi:hypothetical protein